MSGPTRWVIATHNQGKLKEFQTLLAPLGVVLVGASELGIESPIEDGLTFVENALIKARAAARASGLPALADDSGLAVRALGGAPGVRSARYAGPEATDADNVAKLIDTMGSVAPEDRSARFVCALALLRHGDDPEPLLATGEWPGEILAEPIGDGGFGYDPVFFDPALGLTAAQMDPAEKNRRSHRGRASRVLIERLPAWLES